MTRYTLLVLLAGCGSSPEAPPIARDDHFTIAEDDAAAINMTTIEANDENGYDARIVDHPQHGSLDGTSLAYSPDPGYHGPDRFSYEISNSGGSATAEVTIDIMSDGVPYEQSMRLDPATGVGLAIADLDGDGKPDIVFANSNADTITVLVNTGTGPGQYAATALRFEGGHQPLAIAVADFDGDGRPDIVTASKVDGLVVLRNLTVPGAPLAFDAPLYVPAGQAVAVVAADLDGDGRPDLASIDGNANLMYVRINTSTSGTIAFGARTSFATSNQPSAIDAVDADGMGGLDLIVLEQYPSELSLFTNATSVGAVVPTFGARVDRATGTQPTSLFVADLDADGRPEIGVLADDLWIYKNQTPVGTAPSYEAARVLALNNAGGAVAPYDLDQDGVTDLVVGAQPFSLLFNRYTAGGGFDFMAHPGIVASADPHKRLMLTQVYSLRVTDLDGAPPAEIVLTGSDGTYVLFGD